MSPRPLTWPLYLAATLGAVLAVELVFDFADLGKFSLFGMAFMVLAFIAMDFFTDDLPGQEQDEEQPHG